MRYGSICSGVEAATLAWRPLGWKPVFFAEVEPFPSAVLMQKFGATKPQRPLDPTHAPSAKEKKQRENWIRQIGKFPDGGNIPNLGDFTKITKDDYDGKIDLLVGGTCCQSFSVAGLRKGLDDPRGNLSLEFARLAFRTEARCVLWENVPGVFSSNKGEDFAQFLSLLCGWEVEVPVLKRKKNGQTVRGWKNSGIVAPAPGGYGLAWRTLDAQFMRVEPGFPRAIPQRRRRVFIVGYLDNCQRAYEVLFEPGCFERHPEPRREKGQGTAGGFEVGPAGGRRTEVSATLDTKCKDGAIRNQTGMLCMAHGQGNAEVCDSKSPTLNCNHEAPIVTCYENHPQDSRIRKLEDDVSPQINAKCGLGGNNLPLIRVAGFLPGQGKKAGSIGYEKDIAPTLRSGCDNYGVVKTYGNAENIINRKVKNGGNGIGVQKELQYTLNTSAPPGVCCFVKNDAARDHSKDVAMTLRGQAEHAVSYRSTVRRLMPVETERLMGFPDNHTQIEWNGKPKEQCPDGPRYKACGNSFPVNTVRWIGKRIQQVEDYYNGRK